MKEIKLSGICKLFDNVVALHDVNLTIKAGRIVALVGDNGSGKSTLIKILSGYLKPDQGRIEIDGCTFNALSPKESIENGIAVVYQDLALDDCKNSYENIFLGQELVKARFFLDREKMRHDALELLDQMHVHIPNIDLPVKHLSGGQRQAIAIARAMAVDGDLVILDEPTSAMSISASRKIMKLVASIKKRGKACIIINHNLFQVYDVADEIHVLDYGQIVRSFDTSETSAEVIYEYLKAIR